MLLRIESMPTTQQEDDDEEEEELEEEEEDRHLLPFLSVFSEITNFYVVFSIKCVPVLHSALEVAPV